MAPPWVGVGFVRSALGEWTTFEGALWRRLAAALEAAIQRGDLPEGTRLPAERRLASALAVSRGTVVAAYDSLRRDGLVERRQGSGTWVTAPSAGAQVVELADHAAGVRARRLTARAIGRAVDTIDLGVSILPDASFLPARSLPTSVDEIVQLGEAHGYHPLGLPALRRRIAQIHTANGLPTEPGQIVVTGGAQQAIALTARLLVQPGDRVIVENPTYSGAIDVYSRARAHLVPVPSDGGGARVDVLLREAARTNARLAYLMPSFHNPTGALMPESRRRSLAEVTAHTETWIVEDNSLEHLLLADAVVPRPVAAFADEERVLTIGSLSKLLWGGLRVGWVRGPASAIARLGRIKAALDLGGSAVSQAIALRALDDYEQVAARIRETYRARSRHLQGRLAHQLPSWRFEPPAGGLSLWVRLPEGTADDLTRPAAARGVAFLPGGSASCDETYIDHIRLSFALPEEQLDEAVGRLAAAWSDLRGSEHPDTGSA